MNAQRAQGTAERILKVAEGLVQTRGFNGFSYADVAEALGVRKASLHHHFATKADLGLALVHRYRREFLAALAAIEAGESDAATRLQRYVDLYAAVLRRRRMCLCGMMAADVATLPKEIREAVAEFFTENEAWLVRVLEAGRSQRQLRFAGPAQPLAAFIIGALEGAMLLARGSGHPEEFTAAAGRLIALIGAGDAAG